MSTSSVTSSTVSTGAAVDVSSLTKGSYTVSLNEAVTTKVQPYLDRADSVQTEIVSNTTTLSAYQSMQSLLLSLESSVANLTSEATLGSNAFKARAAALSSSSSSVTASSLLTASVSSGTNTGSHTLVVQQLAQAEVDSSATQSVSSTTALGYTGTITIGESGKTAKSLSITSSMSVTDIVSSINSYSSTTGVTASVVAVDSSHSVLVLSGADTNKPLTLTDTSGNVLSSLGLIGSTITGSKAVSSTSSALDYTGSFSVDGGANGSFSVSVTATMTLADIVSAINTASDSAAGSGSGSGDIQASISSDNKLVLKSSAGDSLSFSSVTGEALANLGIPQSGALSQSYASQPAKLTVDGVTGIERDSNTITDVISGVTLNLAAADSTTTITLNIKADTDKVTSAISSFVSAYNIWESFVTANEATTSSGTASSSAVLFGNQTMREASLQIDNTLTGLIRSNSLAGLGVTINSDNLLNIDSSTLAEQLTSNFSGAMNLFNSVATTSDTSLQPYGTNYSTFSGSFSMTIGTDSSGNVSTVSVGGDSSLFTISGNIISGKSGSAYAGMSFNYSGTGGTITVTSTQGVASQLYQVANKFANASSGTVTSLISSLESQNTTLTSEYNNYITDANNYASYLLSWYATTESKINEAGQTASLIKQLLTAQYSSN